MCDLLANLQNDVYNVSHRYCTYTFMNGFASALFSAAFNHDIFKDIIGTI
jgi:hypothetical protein